MNYKYLQTPDGANRHVALLSPSNKIELVIPLFTPSKELDDFNAWLAEGNEPLPADEPAAE